MTQLAKMMESSKAMAKHIKQVASNQQAAQINLIHHQCTEFPPSKFKRKEKKPLGKITTSSITMKKNKEKECHKCTRNMRITRYMQARKDVQNVVIHNILRDLDVQLASTNVKVPQVWSF